MSEPDYGKKEAEEVSGAWEGLLSPSPPGSGVVSIILYASIIILNGQAGTVPRVFLAGFPMFQLQKRRILPGGGREGLELPAVDRPGSGGQGMGNGHSLHYC